ncbi:MAG: hypothetical protein IV100_24800 [Myxococcales bacterium]|nr:hypothetical protein [Myxococcales bacterium]
MSLTAFMNHHLRALALAALVASPAAFADEPKADAQADTNGAKGGNTRSKAASLTNLNEINDELVIVGKIQKPEVFYILGKSDFAYKGVKLARSFVDEIGRSVRSNPF